MIADQRDHQREVAVDGVDEVGVLRRLPPTRDVRPGGVGGVAHARRACRRPASLPLSAIGNASTSARAVRGASRRRRAPRRRGCRRRRRSAAATSSGIGRAVDEHLVRRAARPRRCPSASSATRPALRARPTCAIVSASEAPRCRSAARRRPARGSTASADAGREPAAAHDQPRAQRVQARGSPCRRCAGAASRAARRASASTTGSSVIATATRHERDQHAAVAHRAQERQRQRDQREQADRDGRAAEDDGAAGRLHRAHDRLVALRPCARSSRQRTTISSE